jgi:glycosyltransferase involved in cell wall biosynthesis
MRSIPVVVHLRNDIECDYARRVFLTSSDSIIANSESTGRSFRQRYGKRVKWYNIYNPIEDYGIAHETRNSVPVITMLSQLTPIKGVDTFIRMASHLKNGGFLARHKIVGSETEFFIGYKRELEDLVRSLDVSDRVEFVDFVIDTKPVYAGSDIVVVPSRKEAFGRVAAEAALSGIPVVASNVGGLPEVVVDGVTGYLVEPEDVTAFCERVQNLLIDRRLADTFGRSARRRALELFSPEVHAKKVMQVYLNLLGRDKPVSLIS